MKSWFKWISKQGVKPSYNKDFAARIILSNRIMLICIALTLPFCILFWLLGYPSLGAGIVLLCSLYASCILWHAKGFHQIALTQTWVLPIIGILLYFLFTGPEAGFHFILFFCASLGVILFHRSNKFMVTISMIIPVILFFICDIYGNQFVIERLFSGSIITILRILAMLITFLCIISVVSIYVAQSVRLITFRREQALVSKTKLQSLKQDIELKNTLLESYSAKDAYIEATTGVAHEIRSPMASLLAGAELLRDHVDDHDAVKEFSELMIKTIGRLKGLTQSMLTVGVNTSEKKTKFRISQLIKELVLLVSYQCRRKGISIVTHFKDEQDIKANREYIGQALLNIMVNAMQHIPKKGSITIETSINEAMSTLKTTVSDNGPGIEKDVLPEMFNVHKTTKKESHNTGLGLAFVKRVVDDHHGTVDVQSVKNEGTTFTLVLPLDA